MTTKPQPFESNLADELRQHRIDKMQMLGAALTGVILVPFEDVHLSGNLLTEFARALSPDRPLLPQSGQTAGGVVRGVGEPFEAPEGSKLPQVQRDRCREATAEEFDTITTAEDLIRRANFLAQVQGAKLNVQSNDRRLEDIDTEIVKLQADRTARETIGSSFRANLLMHESRLEAFYARRGAPSEVAAAYDAAAKLQAENTRKRALATAEANKGPKVMGAVMRGGKSEPIY